MTITYGFYNSVSSDRLYDAIQMSRIFDGIIEDGVYGALGDAFLVVENTGMNVAVGTGRAWFNHTWTYNDAAIILGVTTADAVLPRIDVVYLEVNEDSGTRANKIDILDGTPASTPVAPTLTDTSTVHQYPLAHILVSAGVTEIVQDDITNKIGQTETPFVTGPLSVVSTSELLAQWEAEFGTWFDSIKGQLDGEAETLLQNQINAIVGDMNPPLTDLIEVLGHDHTAPFQQVIAGGIASGAITEAKLGTGAVTNTKLGLYSVTTSKIDNGTITGDKIASNSISLVKMLDNSVDTEELVNDAVTNAKVAVNAIDTTQIVNEAVTAAKIDNRTRRIMFSAGNLNDYNCQGNLYTYGIVQDLKDDQSSYLMGGFAIPSDWLSGVITVEIYVQCFASGSARITFEHLNMDDSFDSTQSEAVILEVTVASNNGWTAVRRSLGSMSAFIAGDDIMFRIARLYNHAADTVVGGFGIMGICFEYTADS